MPQGEYVVTEAPEGHDDLLGAKVVVAGRQVRVEYATADGAEVVVTYVQCANDD